MLEASSSIYIGSGSKISSGIGNVIIGAGGSSPAGQALTTGYQNVIIGPGSGDVISTGLENTIVGSSANGTANSQRSTSIGFASLRTATTSTGAKNTALGWNAGSGNHGVSPFSQSLGAGVENVFLGAQTGITSGSGTVNNTVVVGFGALSSGSNTVVIGNDSIVATYLKGSVNATSFTGSLFGTASFALTASYATNAGASGISIQDVWSYSGI